MAAKKNARRPRSQKTTKAPRAPNSTRAQALNLIRWRIKQYEADLAILQAVATQLEGTGGRASAAAKIVKSARVAGWL